MSIQIQAVDEYIFAAIPLLFVQLAHFLEDYFEVDSLECFVQGLDETEIV